MAAPCAASLHAIARPMPREAPVTIATWPVQAMDRSSPRWSASVIASSARYAQADRRLLTVTLDRPRLLTTCSFPPGTPHGASGLLCFAAASGQLPHLNPAPICGSSPIIYPLSCRGALFRASLIQSRGCAPRRKYGFKFLRPFGNFCFTCSSGIAAGTTTSSP